MRQEFVKRESDLINQIKNPDLVPSKDTNNQGVFRIVQQKDEL
jgi:hypothetical protein